MIVIAITLSIIGVAVFVEREMAKDVHFELKIRIK
jgi:hypothetical protein